MSIPSRFGGIYRFGGCDPTITMIDLTSTTLTLVAKASSKPILTTAVATP